MSVRGRSVADLVRSGNVFGDICWRRSVKDERDATRISRMGLRTIRTLRDELQQFGLFCNVLGILSDPWHAITDLSMPLRISEGHYGCYG